MDTLDEILIDVVMLVIKKMNDEQFNPIFYSLVDWASKGLPQDDVDGRMLRTTSLFRFLEIFMADLHVSQVTSLCTE